MEISLNIWELGLGIITIISFVMNILQYRRRKVMQNQAKGIYNQLYDIVEEIDSERLKEPTEFKNLINQVRIQTISLNRSLGSIPEIIRPYDFFKKNDSKNTLN